MLAHLLLGAARRPPAAWYIHSRAANGPRTDGRTSADYAPPGGRNGRTTAQRADGTDEPKSRHNDGRTADFGRTADNILEAKINIRPSFSKVREGPGRLGSPQITDFSPRERRTAVRVESVESTDSLFK